MKRDTLLRRYAEQDEAAIASAVTALEGAPNGRKFLWWMLEIAGVGSQPFTADTHMTAFKCGELNVGNRLLERISPSGYTTMMQEKQSERSDRDTELLGTDTPDGSEPEPHYGGGNESPGDE